MTVPAAFRWNRWSRPRLVAAPLMVLAVALGSASCQNAEQQRKRQLEKGSATVTHVVICTLKEPWSEGARRQVIEAAYGLRSIPGVVDVTAGERIPSDRPVNNTRFHVGIVMTFVDRQALNDYIDHPEHQRAVREILEPYGRYFEVFDFTIAPNPNANTNAKGNRR